MAAEHTIAGTVLTMPVRVRRADVHTAMFTVPAPATQRMIDYSGLQVCQFRPGRAVVTLMLARYFDGDLGSYHEFGTCVMVNPPTAPAAAGLRALGRAAAFIHRLPVDQAFTLEAGRTIWGFPKTMAEFSVTDAGRTFGVTVTEGGALIAAMEFGAGLPVPAPRTRTQVLTTYTHAEGATREVPWEMRTTGVRFRPAGATVRLGEHAFGRELAALGLPRRPMVSGSVGNVEMSFGDARILR
jgi:hypothetical protein